MSIDSTVKDRSRRKMLKSSGPRIDPCGPQKAFLFIHCIHYLSELFVFFF